MWVSVGDFIQGTSHIKSNTPCQDYILSWSKDDCHCIVLADGAGSCKLSHIGAEITCKAICDVITKRFDSFYSDSDVDIQSNIIHCIRTRIGIRAKKLGLSKSEFSSTLLFVAVKSGKCLFGHLGDGVIAAITNSELKTISYPENGEFANTTYFTTSKNYRNHFRIYRLHDISQIKAFVLMSDGAAECLFHKKDGSLAPALNTFSSWICEHPIDIVKKAIKDNMAEHFVSRTTDDCSLIFLQNMSHSNK